MKKLLPLFTLALPATLSLATAAPAGYQERIETVKKTVQEKFSSGGIQAALTELEKLGREFIRDFPDQADGYQMLLSVIENASAEKALPLLKELEGLSAKAPDDVKKALAGTKAKLEALGKPLDIKFTAIDGRPIDLTNMKGKVVLVDFWATWCGPCIAEVPNMKAAYDKLHSKGFEIVGISFDSDRAKLDSFLKEKGLAWPQYFDGKGFENEFGKKYGIRGIPTMWLVDKNGNLADMSARQELEAKVERLLAQ